jgi:L,D-transpeptidase YcbB
MLRVPTLCYRLTSGLLLCGALSALPTLAAATDLATQLAALGRGQPVAGEAIEAPALIAKLYGATPKPLWNAATLASLNTAIAQAPEDGLLAQDYFAKTLSRPDLDPASREVLATEALIRLAYSLRFGKINPALLDPNWNYSRRLDGIDPVTWVRDTLTRGDIPAALAKIRPDGQYYRDLRQALADYRTLAAHGGWQPVPAGATLKPAMDDPRVPALRARLRAEKLLDAEGQGQHYDAALAASVMNFQRRQGLSPDGAIGPGTLAALNVPVAARIATLRLNLERLRWVFRDFAPEFVVVNVAGFNAAYVKQGKTLWQGRAIVGKPFRQTPLFKAQIAYLEFNPTWTVPPTILREDMLPKIRANRQYLQQKNLEVIDGGGRVIDPARVDWQRFTYTLRQKPGPTNALGQVKFMFPNQHAVYLHDTPARELFGQSERAASSGCIRVERPLELAEVLLQDASQWNRAAIAAVVAAGRTTRVNLPRKVPVMLLYLTAFPAPDGAPQFRRDLYGRDPDRLRALDGPFALAAPEDYATSKAR